MKRRRGVVFKASASNVALFFAGMALVSWIGFMLLSGYPLVVWAYYSVFPDTSSKLALLLSRVGDPPPVDDTASEVVLRKLPFLDESLNDGHRLIIPRIGVDGVIYEGERENYESLLRKGVWRMPDFAFPDDVKTPLPMVLVAHRFGYLEWSNRYRRENSFYSLPKLEPGDRIEVLWEQRRYEYEVYRVEEAENISDYSADLILYTCKFLVSPLRIIVYAERVN